MAGDAEHSEIRRLLIFINEAWLQGRADEMAQHLHENMVIRGPDYRLLARGRDACLAHYAEFAHRASAHQFRQTEPPEVDVAGNFALAGYAWEVEYERRGRQFKESGREVLGFVSEQGRWLVIWRLMQPAPKRRRNQK